VDIHFQLSEKFKDLPFRPTPAKKAFPEWLHAMQPEPYGKYVGKRTIKACPPVTDMCSMGYLLPLWFEFYLKWNNESGAYIHTDRLSTSGMPAITNHHPEQYASTYFRNYSVFKLTSPWVIKTPPGTSIMIIPPVYRNDCPFEVMPAVIDTDSYQGTFSFTCKIKIDKENVIACDPGMAFAQLIPFKRTDWQQHVDIISEAEHQRGSNSLRYYVSSAYKKLFWKKKGFN
jgi:hypothetical protein